MKIQYKKTDKAIDDLSHKNAVGNRTEEKKFEIYNIIFPFFVQIILLL